MGYYLQAIIADRETLQAHIRDYHSATIAPLGFGLALIPATDVLLEEIGDAGAAAGFEKLTPALAEWLQTISLRSSTAYVEAEYFGGVGNQSSVLWFHGQEILRAVQDRNAINKALRGLGVVRTLSRDEFAAVGLPKHRNTSDWGAESRSEDATR